MSIQSSRSDGNGRPAFSGRSANFPSELVVWKEVSAYHADMEIQQKEESLTSLQSTIRKLEKAAESQMQKGLPAKVTVQRLVAMRIAYAVVAEEDLSGFTKTHMKEAQKVLLSLLPSLFRMQTKFADNSSQHTLLVRRIRSIELALARLDEMLGKDLS